jgi:hypothetical protein
VNENISIMKYYKKDGKKLYKEGIRYVAKITLWKSQRHLLAEIFNWSEKNMFLWEWFETVYQEKPNNGLSSKEISFIYFIKKTEIDRFSDMIPQSLHHFVHIEEFDPLIYDYYKPARKGQGVVKHHPKA